METQSEVAEVILTAKDSKKVEQGKWLAQHSVKSKRDKDRKIFMENDDDELRKHFMGKFREENFSYLPLHTLSARRNFITCSAHNVPK